MNLWCVCLRCEKTANHVDSIRVFSVKRSSIHFFFITISFANCWSSIISKNYRNNFLFFILIWVVWVFRYIFPIYISFSELFLSWVHAVRNLLSLDNDIDIIFWVVCSQRRCSIVTKFYGTFVIGAILIRCSRSKLLIRK